MLPCGCGFSVSLHYDRAINDFESTKDLGVFSTELRVSGGDDPTTHMEHKVMARTKHVLLDKLHNRD